MTDKTISKQSLVSLCQTLVTGLTNLAGADPIVSEGGSLTKAQVLAPLLAFVVLPTNTANAKTAHAKAVRAEADGKEAVLTMINDTIHPYLQLRLGKSSEDLRTYGLEPAKVTPRSAATKAAAVVKAKATRKALGTKGSAQKKAAKKALAEQSATPATAPTATPTATK